MKNLDVPLISIAITCYKEGAYLSEALDSVLAQTYSCWKAVLVKDGGGDSATDKIFSEIEHPRLVKYEFKENVGPYAARNKAVSLANTEFIFPMDGDDKLPCDSMERITAKFARRPDLDFTYGDIQYFGEITKTDRFSETITVDNVVPRNDMPGVVVYRKKVWEELGGYALELKDGMADYDFNVGLVERGYKGEHIGDGYIYYCYRQKKSGHVSRSYGVRIYEKRRIICHRHPKLFADRKLKRLFLGFGALTTADHLGQSGDFSGCRQMALKALRYGYLRPGAFFMALFSFPFSLVKRKCCSCFCGRDTA